MNTVVKCLCLLGAVTGLSVIDLRTATTRASRLSKFKSAIG